MAQALSISDIAILSLVVIGITYYYFQSNKKAVEAELNAASTDNKVKTLSIDEKKKLPIMTHAELREFNGKDGKPIYIGILNDIFDCTKGQNFYGAGGAYESFAGRDITLAAAKFSTEEKYLDKYDITDITDAEFDSLRHYYNVLNGKYPNVARFDKSKKNE